MTILFDLTTSIFYDMFWQCQFTKHSELTTENRFKMSLTINYVRWLLNEKLLKLHDKVLPLSIDNNISSLAITIFHHES